LNSGETPLPLLNSGETPLPLLNSGETPLPLFRVAVLSCSDPAGWQK
jgi:hypothetical protein